MITFLTIIILLQVAIIYKNFEKIKKLKDDKCELYQDICILQTIIKNEQKGLNNE